MPLRQSRYSAYCFGISPGSLRRFAPRQSGADGIHRRAGYREWRTTQCLPGEAVEVGIELRNAAAVAEGRAVRRGQQAFDRQPFGDYHGMSRQLDVVVRDMRTL